MKQPLLFITVCLLAASTTTAQCDGLRFFNQVFNDYTEIEDIVYGENIDYQGNVTELELDVYQPIGDTEAARPLIIMVHGGSFISGSKDGPDVTSLAADFSKMGYVVASINYRLGITIGLDLEASATESVIRGFHDGKAAVRYFRKDVAENGNTYDINPDEIYMVGVSAGGFISLHVAYMDEVSEIPSWADTTLPGLGGGIEGESGNAGYSSEVKGIVNIAGAIGDTTWMQPTDAPVLSFHGTNDGTVPFGSDVLQLLGIDITEVDGSSSVHEKANEIGLLNCFEIHEGQGHVPHVGNEAYYDTTRAIMSNFIGSLVCPLTEMDCEYRELELSTNDLQALEGLSIYPNPARKTVTIEVPTQISSNNLTVYGIDGRIVDSFNITSGVARLEVEGWASGIYIVEVNSNQGIITERLIIE